jgi:acyl-coenzyme A thioesterase PaaI-like protein
VKATPFAKHTLVELVELTDGRAVARIPADAELRNHIGTQHAGALFTAGETASGAAVAAVFAAVLGTARLVAVSAKISYINAASTAVVAVATVDQSPDKLRAELERDGKVVFPVSIMLADEAGQDVASMRVEWHVSVLKTVADTSRELPPEVLFPLLAQ